MRRKKGRKGEKVAVRCESERKEGKGDRWKEREKEREKEKDYISRLSRPSIRTVVSRVWMWSRGYIGTMEAIFNSIC